MKKYLYTDGVENITLAGGMVRLNLFHYDGVPAEGQRELPREVDQQLVMPPAAFVKAFESMQRFVTELEKSGMLRRNPQTPAQAPESSPEKSGSPNFD